MTNDAVSAPAAAGSAVTLSVDESRLRELIRDLLDEARRQGADQAEAAVSVDAGLTVSVRLGDVETLEYQRDRGLGVTVYMGQRKASASTADLSEAAVRETVRKACSIARYTAGDPCAGLADAELMHDETLSPPLDLAHPWHVEPAEAIEIATRCEATARDADKRITNSEGASVSTHQGLRVYGNTHGFAGAHASTRHSISCSVLASTGDSMERDYWYTTAREAGSLDSPEAVGARAAQRVVDRLGAVKLSTRKAPVLFVPELARGLIGHYLAAMRGTAQYREASFLLNAEGEQLFPSFMQIEQNPHIPRALASAAFDSEGVTTRRREMVTDGVLQGYILSSYSARKLERATTGNAGGIWNILVQPGKLDLDGLIAKMGTGLIVSELIGQGVNGVTGDYSRGAAGFWVENGEIAHPVSEITIAGNLRDMYANIVGVGSDVDVRGAVRCGSILIEQMTIAGD